MTQPCNAPEFRCPIENQLEQLLIEFREFRKEMIEWREEIGTRLTEVEVKGKDVWGNGQPGRMRKSEDAIVDLQKSRNWAIGWAVGVAGLASMLFEVIKIKAAH